MKYFFKIIAILISIPLIGYLLLWAFMGNHMEVFFYGLWAGFPFIYYFYGRKHSNWLWIIIGIILYGLFAITLIG